MKNKRRRTIILLVILILSISIGFAVLTTVLNINGLGLIKGNTWDVHWANAQVIDGSVSNAKPVIGQDSGDPVNTKATWSCEFTEPGQYYSFTIDAVNDGTIDALINEIQVTATPALPEYINYRVVYYEGGSPKDGDLLPKNSSKKYKVTIEYSEDITPEELNDLPDSTTYTFEMETPYDQVISTPETGYTAKVDLRVGDEILKGKTDAQLVEYYGDDVTGLSTVYPIEWQLFYSDEDNVYLITKDYVRNKYLPKELYKLGDDTASNPSYRSDFGYAEYINGQQLTRGDIIHSEPWINGSSSVAIQNNPLTAKYLKFASAYPNSVSDNVRATAYMMDTSIWANFAGNAESAFAMGGPTLEMWILSYNAKHDDDFATYDTIVDGTSGHITGYYNLKKADGTTSTYIDTTNSMWNISGDKTKAQYYWLASPYGVGGNQATSPSVFAVGSESLDGGAVTGIYDDIQQYEHTSHVGFRPLVAIPKSSLK